MKGRAAGATMKSTRKAQRNSDLFRKLPSVDELLRLQPVMALVERNGHVAVADAARAALERLRAEIAAGRTDESAVKQAVAMLPDAITQQLQHALECSLRPVINATGVILHTNLGRAPLMPSAFPHMQEVGTAYSNLEFDLAAGDRGKRDVHVQRLFTKLLGDSVSTIVVNNNAAAVLLALNTLAEGGEVIVSRGELVEIGGSFRIPDVMSKSAALLREVGTTNRTRLSDYERALNERTRLLLRVHRSNFQIVGFTEQPALEDLVALGRKRGVPVMEDLGSGALFDLRSVGIAGEPGVSDSLRAGVDVVTYSGDKLLGGPQAGLLSGRPEVIARLRANPLFRALRVDKLTYAALEVTLLAYLRQDYDAIPAVRMMRLSAEEIGRRAETLVTSLRKNAPKLRVEVIEGQSLIGGGAAPAAALPTRLVTLVMPETGPNEFAARLRQSDPPIIARVEEDRVVLDLRTVFPEQDVAIENALARIAGP